MNPRSTPGDPPPANSARLWRWLVAALALAAGVLLAFWYGPDVVPLIDGGR